MRIDDVVPSHSLSVRLQCGAHVSSTSSSFFRLTATRMASAQRASSRPARTFTRSSRSTACSSGARRVSGWPLAHHRHCLQLNRVQRTWGARGRDLDHALRRPREATRLLSAGYNDQVPGWFPVATTGVRVGSCVTRRIAQDVCDDGGDRPEDGSGRRRHRGRSQPTRRRSSDKSRPTESGCPTSCRQKAIKAVPSTGGASRTLVKMEMV